MPTAASSADTTGSRGAKAYFVASTVAQVSALVRYTIMSRLLGPEQLGLADDVLDDLRPHPGGQRRIGGHRIGRAASRGGAVVGIGGEEAIHLVSIARPAGDYGRGR